MAKLIFKYATMNSGKTLDLIRTAFNYEENGFNIEVIKPLIDTKGENKITSRVGVERQVDYLISRDDDIEAIYKNRKDVDCIFVDEAQFLTREQINQLYNITKIYDIPVICYGLRLNFKMEAFEGSMRLLEISEKLEGLKTICKCGNMATCVGRKVNGIFTLDGEEVVIDGTDNVEYVPLCGDCYLHDVKKINIAKVKTKKKFGD